MSRNIPDILYLNICMVLGGLFCVKHVLFGWSQVFECPTQEVCKCTDCVSLSKPYVHNYAYNCISILYLNI